MIVHYGKEDENPIILQATNGTQIKVEWMPDNKQFVFSFSNKNKSVNKLVEFLSKTNGVLMGKTTQCVVHA